MSQQPSRDGTPDKGERFATLDRGKGQELRVSVDEYDGKPYVHLRVWEKARTGSYWPTKRGMSIRFRELDEVIGALTAIRDAVCAQTPSQHTQRPARAKATASHNLSSSKEFDEFR